MTEVHFNTNPTDEPSQKATPRGDADCMQSNNISKAPQL